MRRPFICSLILHLLVLVVAILGLPSLRQPPVLEEEPVVVDLVPVSEKSNPPPAAQLAPKLEAQKPMEPPAPKPEPPRPEPPQAKPEAPPVMEQPTPAARPEASPARPPESPSEPEPKAEPRPAPAKPAPPPEKAEERPAPPKPEPKTVAREEPEPEPKAEPRPQAKPKPPVEPKPEATKPEAKPAPAPEHKPEARRPSDTQTKMTPAAKPEPAKQEAPRTEQKPEPASDFAAISKAVRELKRTGPADDDKPAKPALPSPKNAVEDGDAAFTSRVAQALRSTAPASSKPSMPVSSSEIDAVRRQIERCWNLPEGTKDAGSLVVSIRVEMNADGTPRSAVIQNAGQTQANPYFQAAADSARRAVLNPRCHPFKLPPEKFEHWRTMTLIFNPKEVS
jgi:hypothetical protein